MYFKTPMASKPTHDELFDDKNIFYDEEDKERIMSLPELQREQILNERFQKMNNNDLVKTLREFDKQEKTASEPKKRPKFEECDFVVGRDLILNNVFKPFINILKGSFVKAMINKKYAICKISAIKTVNPYKLLNGSNQMCSVGLDLDNGTKIYSGVEINSVSSSRVTQDEFEAFIDNFSIESLDDLKKKYKKIRDEFSRCLTDTEVSKTIENRMKDNPKSQTSTEKKIEIIAKRDEAIQNKDKEKATFYQTKLEEIEDQEREIRKKKLMDDDCKRKRRVWF